jgi:DNA-binding NtrC family response regulator
VKSALVISKNREAPARIESCLSGYTIHRVPDREKALELVQKRRIDLIFADLDLVRGDLLKEDYQRILQPFWRFSPSTEMIMMTDPGAIREAVMAVKAGAGDYLTYPLNPAEIRYVTEHLYIARKKDSELDYLRDQFWETESHEIVKTRSPLMKQVFDKIRSVAPTKTTVMLYGETGVGKGIIAGLIHRHSNRKNQPYISLHCGAIPDTLLESELFGHEKGAFTGAVKRKPGKFEIAQEGTLFMDEIGTVTPAAQIKLLQVLQDRTFQRVGGEEVIEANVRIIAASNSDLKVMSDEGAFRKDLYYRLHVFPVEIPSLRDRIKDISLLVDYFLNRLNLYYAKGIHGVHPAVMEALERYDWPGNIRELENLVERAYILESGTALTPDSFPAELFGRESESPAARFDSGLTLAEVRQNGVEAIECRYLKEVLTRNRGKINESAREAGISTRQLHKLLTRYDIHKESFK